MLGWIISAILAIIVVLFSGSVSEGFGNAADPLPTVGLRKPARTSGRPPSIHIPTVPKESSFWSSTPGLKSALKPSGTPSKKKSIKWADHAEYRAINPKGKITDKTVKIN